jgi:hypothetical protein
MSVCIREEAVTGIGSCVHDGLALALTRNWLLPTDSVLLKAVVSLIGLAIEPMVLSSSHSRRLE